MSCIKMCEQKGAGYWNNLTGRQPLYFSLTRPPGKTTTATILNLYFDEEKIAIIVYAVQCHYCQVTLIFTNSGSQMFK